MAPSMFTEGPFFLLGITPYLPHNAAAFTFCATIQPSAAAPVLAWINRVQLIWHCIPNGRHPSSITLT